MSVHVEDDVIRLAGRCLAEDAEALLVALQERPARIVDLGGVQRLHLAVAQILIAARPAIRGVPQNTFLARHVFNVVQ